MADPIVQGIGFAIVFTLISLALLLSFAIGANDETSAPLAAAGNLKFVNVLIIGGFGLFIGIVFFSQNVAEMVGSKIYGETRPSVYMLLAVLISAVAWLIVGSFAGAPLSSTHSLIGSIFGVVIVNVLFVGSFQFMTAFNWEKLGSVVISWFISPLAGLVVTYIFYKIFAKFILSKDKGLTEIENTESKFSILLIITVFIGCIWTGANSAEALGILYALYDGGHFTIAEYLILVIICGVFAFFGTFIAGRHVIRTLASELTESRPSDGFIIMLSAAIILMVCTVFYSVPISSSHVVVFAFFGLSMAKGHEMDIGGLKKMFVFWVITFPIAALGAGLIYLGFVMNGLV